MRFLVSAVSIALIAAIAVVSLLRAWREVPDEPQGPQPIPVTVVEARPAAATESIAATGVLVLKRETLLSFKVAGVIASLDARAGDAVQVGQVLARLDQTEIAAREREARAQLDLARKEYARAAELFGRGFVAARRVDDAKSALERAQAAFDVVRFDRRWAELRAPWDGVVLNRFAEAGEITTPGRAILAVGDTTGGFNLMAPIADRDVARLTVGDRAEVAFAAADAPVVGRIARLTAKADARTGGFEAEIALDGAPDALRSGMIGEAAIHPRAGPAGAALAVPAEAIVEADGDRALIYVLGKDGAEQRTVRLVRLEGAFAVVDGDLAAGERVVVSGAAYLRPGVEVRVVGPQTVELRRGP